MVSDKLQKQVSTHLGDMPQNDALAALLAEIDVVYAERAARAKQSAHALDVVSAEFMQVVADRDALLLSMRKVLDSLGQAVTFFDREGVCSNIYSSACAALLESEPAGKHIGEVLKLDGDGRKRFQELIDLVFHGRSTIFPFDELMRLAPKRYTHSQGIAVSLQYRPMYNAQKKLFAILLIATDVSREEKAQEEIRLKEARIARMLRIAKDKMAFVGYLRKLEGVLIDPAIKYSMEDFAREVHTLKGMSRFFHLDIMAGILHEMENEMKTRAHVTVDEMLAIARDVVSDVFEEAKGYGREIWGNNFEIQEDVVMLPVSYATEFGRELRAQGAQGIAFRYFQKIVSAPVRDLLIPFETQMNFFAVMAEKQVSVTMPANGEIRVFSPVYKEFFSALVHVARNIVDHAAEETSVREAAGKTAALNVWVDVAYGPFKHTMILTIADDGAGIDEKKLREKLGAAAAAESDEALLQHIFDPRVSTRDAVSEESGRGIGLNAVKAVVEKLGGTVHVDSAQGKGTALTIRLPVIWEPN
ncbi:MAG: cheA [Alphaproteobacteria bacterium]|jgi:two-component system chemotaxis sensor kinase CheA|nr:cheA [Alphaproteobacteria bacterium]